MLILHIGDICVAALGRIDGSDFNHGGLQGFLSQYRYPQAHEKPIHTLEEKDFATESWEVLGCVSFSPTCGP